MSVELTLTQCLAPKKRSTDESENVAEDDGAKSMNRSKIALR